MKLGRCWPSIVDLIDRVRNHTFRTIFLLTISVSLSGCLEKESAAPGTGGGGSGGSGGSAALGFSGASTAENLDGTRIKITWTAASSSNVGGYDVYEKTGGGSGLTWIGSVSSNYLNYTHAGLTPGTIHSYVVRAIDDTGTYTDTNLKTVTAFTYAGATSATATGTTTATVNFPAGGAQAVEVRVYGTTRGTTSLLATVANTDTSANLTGLRSGTTYTFKVVAVSNAGFEDNNTITKTVQTTSLTSTAYKGPIAVSAYGDAPNAPAGTPQARQVSITWQAFTGATTSTEYKLVRVGKGGTIDTTTTTSCTNTMTTSCQVCTVTGSGAKSCTDTNVADSPQQYDYAVVLMLSGGWAEETPSAGDSAYRITIPIPPDNMVLVHRDAANYEQCALMSKVSDPLNHQRCAYTGLGNVPYNSGPGNSALGLSTSYYDFGYNLFVDRWAAACNWTPQSNGGMCGAGATAGNCFGNTDPAGTIGTTGNVYYRTDNANCFYRQSGGWVAINSTSLSSSERAVMYTIDPGANGGKKPPLVNVSQLRSYDTCQAISDANYGNKRLIRKREFNAAAAAPWMNGEPGALTDAEIGTLEQGNLGHGAGVYACNSSNHTGVTAGAFTTTELAGDAGDVIKSFVIGSLGTSKCVSRFGMQDFAGNVWQWTSDQMSCSNVSHTCSGTTSGLDTGNSDVNGIQFDGAQGPGGTGAGQVGPNYTDAWRIHTGVSGGTGSAQGYGAGNFSTPLGLPLVGNDGGNAVAISSFSSKLHDDYFYLYTDNSNASRGLLVGGDWGSGTYAGRWFSYWSIAPATAISGIGFRCALAAE